MQPVKPSEMPQVGEMWMDLNEDHNLVLEVYEDDGDYFAKLLTLETGTVWPAEPVSNWSTNPFYYKLVS